MTTAERTRLITLLLVLAVLTPIGFSIWLSWHQAEKHLLSELQAYSERTIQRAINVEQQAQMALKEINQYQGIPCSRQHLQAMRSISINFRYVQEVLYMQGQQPQCSSLESFDGTLRWPAPYEVSDNGLQLWLAARNDVTDSQQSVALGAGQHVVLIDPVSFIDVIPLGRWPIHAALASQSQHRIIASNGKLDDNLWQQALMEGKTFFTENGNSWLITRRPGTDLALAVWASRRPLEHEHYQQLVIWLPVGMGVSLVAGLLMLRQLQRVRSLCWQLRDAIDAEALDIYYQPIVDLSDGHAAGAEALIRWPQPDGTTLMPDTFIPLAEQAGLSSAITGLVVKKVFAELGSWLQAHPDRHISINYSAEDLCSDELYNLMHSQLRRWQVKPSQIALEITERSFTDPEITSPAINRYRAAGHAIYIDDFGTGYSSLSYLQDLNVDILKIDKCFVDALEHKSVTPHIIEMAKSLHLKMVAEGVETAGQAEWLREHGVDYGQGWYYSKALPASEFMHWCDNHFTPSMINYLRGSS